MKRILMPGVLITLTCSLLLAGGFLGWSLHRRFGEEPVLAASRPQTPTEARALAVLREMVDTGNRRFAVPEADGRRLRLLAESLDAKNVVEVGTSTGYSALWLGLAVASNGGRVTTFELNEQTAANAGQNFLRAGMDSNITVITGDAHKTLAAVKSPIDLVFLDADKEGYVDYLNKLTPLVRPGGLIVAHNVDAAPEYLQRVSTDPQFDTVRLTEGSGLLVTLKKR